MRDISEPKVPPELWQYLHAVVWISSSNQRFVQTAAPFYKLLDEASREAKKRNKRDIANINLTAIGSVATHTVASNGLQEQLQNTFKCDRCDPILWL